MQRLKRSEKALKKKIHQQRSWTLGSSCLQIIFTLQEKFLFFNSTHNNLAFRFVKDAQSDQYERQVFALLDVFGNIGGVNEILEVQD